MFFPNHLIHTSVSVHKELPHSLELSGIVFHGMYLSEKLYWFTVSPRATLKVNLFSSGVFKYKFFSEHHFSHSS